MFLCFCFNYACRSQSSKLMSSLQGSEYPAASCRWNLRRTRNQLSWSTKWNYWELKKTLTSSLLPALQRVWHTDCLQALNEFRALWGQACMVEWVASLLASNDAWTLAQHPRGVCNCPNLKLVLSVNVNKLCCSYLLKKIVLEVLNDDKG